MSHLPYKMVVGLEVHVQLKTNSKLFCRCSTDFGGPPNTQVCPVCLGMPGALPVLNRQAVHLAVKTGLALGSTISTFTKWDRKNYFYPDLPKGYQISQFDLPICVGGGMSIESESRTGEGKFIRLIRAHLEEDAGKSMHDEVAGKSDSRIDLNRTGTPLLEIVSQPDLESPEEAKSYLNELKLLLTYLDVSDCNMQEGSLRVDANVNLHLEDQGEIIATPITEIKNLNSFRAVERALIFEADRQYRQWQSDRKRIGQSPKQTRGWDDAAGVTTLQREKEESADYRYFPDPDLVPVVLEQAEIEMIRAELGELPQAIRRRFQSDLGLKPYDAEVLTSQGPGFARYFEQVLQGGAQAKRTSSWMQQDVLRVLNDRQMTIEGFPITARLLAELLKTIDQGELDTTRGREVFQCLMENPQLDVPTAIKQLGIASVDQGEMEQLCRELLEANPEVVAKVRDGNPKALGSLVGQAKKKNPNADPRIVQELCLKLIEAMSNG